VTLDCTVRIGFAAVIRSLSGRHKSMVVQIIIYILSAEEIFMNSIQCVILLMCLG